MLSIVLGLTAAAKAASFLSCFIHEKISDVCFFRVTFVLAQNDVCSFGALLITK